MERITSKRSWDEAKEDLKNEMGYSHIWTRLNAIENILGDDYDLDRLSVLVNQRMTMREDVAARMKLVGGISLDRLRELVKADRDGRCKIFHRKIGETIYVVGKSKIVEAKITEIYILDDDKDVEYLVDFNCDESCKGCPFYAWEQDWEGEWCCDCEYGDGAIFQKDFGKTVFLTREAAEAALKGE